MSTVPLCVLLLAVTATEAAAAEITLSLPLASDSMVTASFDCGDRTVRALYVTSGVDALALIDLDGEDRIFVNVVSASGSRYVSGVYEWWEKGGKVTLTDATGATPDRTCTATDG